MKRTTSIPLSIIPFFIIFFLLFYFIAQQKVIDKELQEIRIANAKINHSNDSIIRVMTYNIGYLSGMDNNLPIKTEKKVYESNLNKLILALSTEQIDLLAFQEVDYKCKRSCKIDQHDSISNKLFPYSIKAVNWNKKYVPFPFWPPQRHFGTIVSGQSTMSKWVLSDNKRIVLEKVESNPFFYNAFYLDRLAVVSLVHHPLLKFWFINLHTEAFDAQTREKHLSTIYNLFLEKSKTHPVIIAGDFNSDISYKEKSLDLFFNDPQLKCVAFPKDNTPPNTFPTVKPNERIDYIFFSKDYFEEVASEMHYELFNSISDHLPIYTSLRVK